MCKNRHSNRPYGQSDMYTSRLKITFLSDLSPHFLSNHNILTDDSRLQFFIHSAGWLTGGGGSHLFEYNVRQCLSGQLSHGGEAINDDDLSSQRMLVAGQRKVSRSGKLLICFQAHRWDVWCYHHVDPLHKKAFLISYLPHVMLFEVVLIRCVTVIKATSQNTDIVTGHW